MLLFEEAVAEVEWDTICSKIAENINIHDEFVEILQKAAKKDDLGVVVVTCGIGDVWENVLERHGLRDSVTVIGGGRLTNGMIVTPDVKKRVVQYLQSEKNAFVWAFGDSQLDLPMLEQADQAVVAVCSEEARSRSMDEKLTESITDKGLFARQMLLPSYVKPRLSSKLLSVVHPADVAFEIPLSGTLQLMHATNQPVSKMLTAPTRNRDFAGMALQQAHRRVGHHLATELLPQATGLERYHMISVQNEPTKGHRIRNESKTVIVSLMRGGVLSLKASSKLCLQPRTCTLTTPPTSRTRSTPKLSGRRRTSCSATSSSRTEAPWSTLSGDPRKVEQDCSDCHDGRCCSGRCGGGRRRVGQRLGAVLQCQPGCVEVVGEQVYWEGQDGYRGSLVQYHRD